MPDTQVITIKDAAVGYEPHRPLIEHANLDVRSGEIVALVGQSGIGKTTLLKTMAGLLRPIAGTVTVLSAKAPRRPARGTIGIIPQRLGLVTHATALDNVLIGRLHAEPWWRTLLRAPSPDAVERALRALRTVELEHKAHEKVHRLSGGQQRRVAVARALVQRPKVLLADEFLSELDRETAGIVERAVMGLAKDDGCAIVFVEHHISKARRLADRVFHVNDQRLVELHDADMLEDTVHEETADKEPATAAEPPHPDPQHSGGIL